jgi:large subunit ribosomal protein L29
VDTNELRECTNARLDDLEKTLRRQIFEARIKNFTNQLDDTASIRRARKDLARVKTILSERVGATAATAASDDAPVSDAPVSDAGETADAEETE